MARPIRCDFKGEKNGNSKLSDFQIFMLRNEWLTGQFTFRKIAKRYGISHGHAYRIIKHKQR